MTKRRPGRVTATRNPPGAKPAGKAGYITRLPLPWPGVTAPMPTCDPCEWAWKDGTFHLKYVNRLCDQHGRLLEAS